MQVVTTMRVPKRAHTEATYVDVLSRAQKRMRRLLSALSPDGPPSDTAWTRGVHTESLVLAVVFFARVLARQDEGARAREPARRLWLRLAACVVLADKFHNDASYANFLPLVAEPFELDTLALLRAEREVWSALLDGPGLIVGPDEFAAFACLLDDVEWERFSADSSLALLAHTARAHGATLAPPAAAAGTTAPSLLHSGASPPGAARASISGALYALGSTIFRRAGVARAARAADGKAADANAATGSSGGSSSSSGSAAGSSPSFIRRASEPDAQSSGASDRSDARDERTRGRGGAGAAAAASQPGRAATLRRTQPVRTPPAAAAAVVGSQCVAALPPEAPAAPGAPRLPSIVVRRRRSITAPVGPPTTTAADWLASARDSSFRRGSSRAAGVTTRTSAAAVASSARSLMTIHRHPAQTLVR